VEDIRAVHWSMKAYGITVPIVSARWEKHSTVTTSTTGPGWDLLSGSEFLLVIWGRSSQTIYQAVITVWFYKKSNLKEGIGQHRAGPIRPKIQIREFRKIIMRVFATALVLTILTILTSPVYAAEYHVSKHLIRP